MARYLITLSDGSQWTTAETEAGFEGEIYTGNSNLYLLVSNYGSDVYRPYIYAGTDAVRTGTGSWNDGYAQITNVELVSGGLGCPLLVAVACLAVILASIKVVLFRR